MVELYMSEHPQGRGVGCQETKATGQVYCLLKLYVGYMEKLGVSY